MGRVLALAIGLLVVAIFLRTGELWGQGQLSKPPESGLDVFVSARGTLLPPRLVHGREGQYEAIVAGDRILSEDREGTPGIRVARFGADLEFQEYRNFPVGEEDAATESFARWIQKDEGPGLYVLSSSGRITPQDEEARFQIGKLGEHLGWKAPAFEDSPSSWAWIGVKLADRWVSLAESFSRDTGCVLLFTVDADLEAYRNHRGELNATETLGAQVVDLDRDVSRGRIRGRVRALLETKVGEQSLPGILFSRDESLPIGGNSPRIVWDEVFLGANAFFQTRLGCFNSKARRVTKPGEPREPVAFLVLRVDGEVVARRGLTEPGKFENWAGDLRRFSNSTVSLEIGVWFDPEVFGRDEDGGSRGSFVLAQPRLHWGQR